jgi:hypothetical protein
VRDVVFDLALVAALTTYGLLAVCLVLPFALYDLWAYPDSEELLRAHLARGGTAATFRPVRQYD